METQSRLRPSLRPLWTEHRGHLSPPLSYSSRSEHHGLPSPAGLYSSRSEHYGHPVSPGPLTSRSQLYSPSMRSPNMPSPMYPNSPGYDHTMRRHERAMVESLDQRERGRPSPYEARNAQSVTQNANRSLFPIAEQSASSRRAPVDNRSPPLRHPGRSPRSPGLLLPRPRPSLAAETRSILLSGVSDSQSVSERRQSLPPSFPAPRRSSQQVLQELQAWGHVYFGNASDANCFVSALAVRRPSEVSSADEEKEKKDLPRHGKVTIRARVRPCALDRKPFLLHRTFDIDELRATVPEPSPGLPPSSRRFSADLSRRGSQTDQDRRKSLIPGKDTAAHIDKSPVRSTNTVPIHLRYARAYFPMIAALIYSGHIQSRDIIDLPLPRPEAWAQTVAYAYTGQGELTDAIKQNILYLGGKV